MRGAWIIGPLSVLALCLSGCTRAEREYDASTPEAALDSAQRMVLDGDADRLVDLIYVDSDQLRSLLNQVGGLLGSLQDLGDAVDERFPEEIRRFREEAEAAAEAGGSSPLLARLVSAGRPGGANRSFGTSRMDREGLTLDTGAAPRRSTGFLQGPGNESQRQVFIDIMKQVLADPYGWLAREREKLETVYVSDDTVALTWDGRAILPPFGMTLIEREGRWQLVPPTSYPVVRRIMPRNEDEWFVWGSMVKTLDRVVIDLAADVRAGRIRNLTDLADSAVEKVAIPAMLIFFAYSNLVEERQAEAERSEAARAAAEAPPGEGGPGDGGAAAPAASGPDGSMPPPPGADRP